MADSGEVEVEGSWVPFVLFCIIGLISWIAFGQGGTPVRMRRWYNMQRVQYRKKMGLRDESKYTDGAAGDGANQRHKRQG